MASTKSVRPHPFYSQIGRSIRKLRIRPNGPNLSQEDLAGAISLTRASVANIERGRQKIMAHTLLDIAAALKVSPSELLHGIQPDSRADNEFVSQDLSQDAVEWI